MARNRIPSSFPRAALRHLQSPLIATGLVVGTYLLEFHVTNHSYLNFFYRPVGPLIANILLLFGLQSLLGLILRSERLGILVSSGFYSLLIVAHLAKLKYRHDPLIPADLVLAREALSLGVQFVPLGLIVLIALCVALAATIIWNAHRKWNTTTQPLIPRALAIIVSAGLIVTFSQKDSHSVMKVLAPMGFAHAFWDPMVTLSQNGLLVELLTKSRNAAPEPPVNYSRENVYSVVQPHLLSDTNASSHQNPNVILYIMESFTDPSAFGIKTNKDPIPVFRKLMHTSRFGYTLTPAFGGNTNNVEFEILTGLRMANLPFQSGPFHFFVNGPIPALPQSFRDIGYLTRAIHPFFGWFWSRNKAYQHLGFDAFQDVSTFENASTQTSNQILKVLKGDGISGSEFTQDIELAKKIIAFDQTAKSPYFIFALTVFAHGPYENRKGFADYGVRVSNQMTDSSKRALENYLNLIAASDETLGKLIQHFEKSNRPTVIIALGDHQPPLSSDVYAQLEFKKPQNWDHQSLMKTILWANFPVKPTKPFELRSYALGSEIFDIIQKTPPPLFSLAREAAQEDNQLNQVGSNAEPRSGFKMNQHSLIQYDLLFGHQYSLELKNRENKLFTFTSEAPNETEY